MVKEEIRIRKMILHILDSTTGEPVLSDDCLEAGAELQEFIREHIAKLFSGDDSKKCEFHKSESEIYGLLNEYDDENFVPISKDIASYLYSIMNANIDIPSADLFVVRFTSDSLEYLAILKMNYKAMYTHRSIPENNFVRNEIFRYKELLPAESQKLAEACVIRLNDLAIWLVEKKAEINGKKEDYFSELFLKCKTRLSDKKKLKLVEKAIESVNTEAYDELDRYEPNMKAKAIIHEELDKNGGFVVEEIGDLVFKDREDLRTAYQEKVEKFDLVKEEILPQSERTTKRFERQSLVTDTGIEIKIPMDQYENGNVEFITNNDGSMSLVIKNIGKLDAKF
ncbi:MAG: nucleoid-associated protein [Lachnospiraceae bacterium]|nr:nucleoid-associated protein [Lachnospiraceae bacterium]